MESNRTVHYGISDFALWALNETKGQAILAGRHCTVLSVNRNPDKPEGWFFVKVRDTEIGDERLIEATTASMHEIARQRRLMKRTRAAHRKRA